MSEGLRLLASLVSHGSTSAFRSLERGLFVGDDEQRMYDYVREHYRRYSQLPALQTIARDLDINIPRSPEAVEYYLERVHDRAMFNAVQPLYNNLNGLLVDGDMDEARSVIEEMRLACRIHTAERDLLSLREIVPEVGNKIREQFDRYRYTGETLSGSDTGWETLNRETNGYQDGDLIVWAARPGVGKTHLLIHQARTAYHQGKSVMFVSMEMTMQQIAARVIAHEAGLDPNLVRRGQLSPWGWARFREAESTLMVDNRFTLFAGNMGKRTEDLDNAIQEIGPDLIYIDGIYLMKPTQTSSRKSNDKYQNISYVLDDLKEMTITRDRPFVTTTQFNRDGAKKATLENLGFTDALGTHASVIMGIEMLGEGTRPNKRKITILKGREGEAGEFAIDYRFCPISFAETTMPQTRAAETSEDTSDRIRRNREARSQFTSEGWEDDEE